MTENMKEVKHPVGALSFIDRFLPVWIIIAMIIGILLGTIQGVKEAFNAVQFGTVSLPIAIGLLWMMYPVLAKVKYEEISKVAKEGKMFSVSLFLNWIIGPLLMFVLAWIFLPGIDPITTALREGLIIIGLARCIAMVLIWNMLAGGDSEDCAVLVALNSIFQVIFYSIYAYFFLVVVNEWMGIPASTVNITMIDIAISVFVFLGIPLIAGAITRVIGLKMRGREWYDTKFAPHLGSTAIIGLLFTIIVMFSMQGSSILNMGWDLVRVALPLISYFFLMFFASYFISWFLRFDYSKTVTLSFTAASNNFELAIAVAVGTWTIYSQQALAAVIGPLMEVPVLVSLVYVSLWMKKRFFTPTGLSTR